MSAVENHLKHVIVPILYDHEEKGIDQIGSSALIEKNAKLFLLSALHTFQALEGSRFQIPADFNGGRDGYDLIPLWPFEIHPDEANDLVALELNPSVAARARAGWRTIPTSKCGTPTKFGTFAVSGFPSSRVKRPTRDDPRLGGSLITSYVARLLDPPEDAEKPIDPEVDIFLLYKEEGILANGQRFKSPKLHGVSGAPIWELSFPGGHNMPVWTPQDALALVGVQTEARHFKYIRGKQWTVASQLLK